jgi:SNF2 family DNA or RNA helicase
VPLDANVRSLALGALTGWRALAASKHGSGSVRSEDSPPAVDLSAPEAASVDLLAPPGLRDLPSLARALEARSRQARLLDESPWIKSLGKLTLEVGTEGWRFPVSQPLWAPKPKEEPSRRSLDEEALANSRAPSAGNLPPRPKAKTRLKPPADAVTLQERLLCLLQPPLESLFEGRQLHLPLEPFKYQMEGVAFLMPRWSALLADEMGLGKTVQTIIALRLLLYGGMIQRALIVCPKPIVPNWLRELRLWAEDVPVEVIGGDLPARRMGWLVSNCPVKLVNYELLTRDAEFLSPHASRERGDEVHFDLVVLDEAQRIKNHDSKTAQVVRTIRRDRSWALTGTPIENRPEDLISLFDFLKPGYLAADTPVKLLGERTKDSILRRRKEDVLTDLPPRIIRDAFVELTPAQRDTYQLAENEGIVRLNALGDTISVQHVFELVMRLKQICNFDPATGQSAKLEVLLADLAEIAESGRKAIVFSQWVEPLEMLARHLEEFGPLQFHGRVPAKERQAVLSAFRDDPKRHVILMSYGTGSVGLNLQFTNYVFLFDRWWNPAVEDQAINRAHRIGQTEPVFVTRFVTPGTIEGRICQVLERKRQLFEDVIGQSGPPPSLGLSEEEIFGLFDLRARPKRAVLLAPAGERGQG